MACMRCRKPTPQGVTYCGHCARIVGSSPIQLPNPPQETVRYVPLPTVPETPPPVEVVPAAPQVVYVVEDPRGRFQPGQRLRNSEELADYLNSPVSDLPDVDRESYREEHGKKDNIE